MEIASSSYSRNLLWETSWNCELRRVKSKVVARIEPEPTQLCAVALWNCTLVFWFFILPFRRCYRHRARDFGSVFFRVSVSFCAQRIARNTKTYINDTAQSYEILCPVHCALHIHFPVHKKHTPPRNSSFFHSNAKNSKSGAFRRYFARAFSCISQ